MPAAEALCLHLVLPFVSLSVTCQHRLVIKAGGTGESVTRMLVIMAGGTGESVTHMLLWGITSLWVSLALSLFNISYF